LCCSPKRGLISGFSDAHVNLDDSHTLQGRLEAAYSAYYPAIRRYLVRLMGEQASRSRSCHARGGCLRGEISRLTANAVCRLLPEQTVRICLGGAFTKDTGQRALVRNAKRVVALEVIHTDGLARFDKKLFGIEALSHDETVAIASEGVGPG
jgi:hypothetical protein